MSACNFTFSKFQTELNTFLYYSRKNTCIIEDVTDFWKFVQKFESKKQQQQLQNFDSFHENYQYVNLRKHAKKCRCYCNYLNEDKYNEFFGILAFYITFKNNEKLAQLVKLRKCQKNLPITKFREEIIDAVTSHSVVIIAGDTGCGKSTQVPQYLFEAGYKTIACTQPRRIACISLAKRVSFEMLSQFQSVVGYQIRFEKAKFKNTQVVFLTEGLLLRQLSDATILNYYDVIIIDEVHERHLYSDFLLGVMKCFLYTEYKFKLIIMSATINTQLFINYFQNEKLKFLQIPGKMYPVEIIYRPIKKHQIIEKSAKLDPTPYLQILRIIDQKYPRFQKGDVLVFVAGIAEINTLISAIDEYNDEKNWLVLPLHSSLSVVDQEKIFRSCDDGFRKCIISTNIAETSVTIDGIRFVIDSGRVNKMKFSSDVFVNVLNEENISQDSARQRCGRAGRTGPGICYRLYSEEEYHEFDKYTLAEIHSVSLESLILLMGSFGISNITSFPFIEEPNQKSISVAFDRLRQLNCVSGERNAMDFTLLGECLSRLPVDISIGFMLINATVFNFVNTMLIITSLLSVQSPYTNKAYRDIDCLENRKKYESRHGDIFTLLNIFTEWLRIKYERDFDESIKNSKDFTKKIGIEEQRFYEIIKMQNQFKSLLKDSSLIDTSVTNRKTLTSSDRIIRKGQLKQLKLMKHNHKMDSKLNEKSKPKLNISNYDNDDLDDGNFDIQDIDFQISTDTKALYTLLNDSDINMGDDIELIKLILCSGLYPQVAISDEHNFLKSTNENLYHTKNNNFISIHPISYFANCNYDPLSLREDDINQPPAHYTSKNSLSAKHKLLLYQSLLKIKGKSYLSNNTLVSAIHSLLLFSHKVYTNSTITQMLFDEFILIDVPNPNDGKVILFKSLLIKKKWKLLLIQKFQEDNDNEGGDLKEKCNDLFSDLLHFTHIQISYSLKRILSADFKTIFSKNFIENAENLYRLTQNPFDEHFKPVQNHDIGGIQVSDNVIYDCLKETDWTEVVGFKMKQTTYCCQVCGNNIDGHILNKWIHEKFCNVKEISN